MFRALDLFCGAGGISHAIIEACREAGIKLDLTAVNHWETALNSHSLNHPEVRHILEPVENLWPARVIPGRHLHLLTAGVECTFHSNARGGGPCKEQSRSQAWQLIRWCTDIRVDNLLIENVREFMKWGPLDKRTQPIKRRAGEYFRNFISTLKGLGYNVEYRVQRAADFGDPTTRQRLLIIARRVGAGITWPEHTHSKDGAIAGTKRWRPVRDCIDRTLKGKSIKNRAKPLCQNTNDRIIAGMNEFWGEAAVPFIAILNGTSQSHRNTSFQSLDEPLDTVTGSNRFMLVEPIKPEPFLMHITHHGGHKRRCHSLENPMPTLTGSKENALIEPIIVQTDQTGSNGSCCRSINQPLGTIVSKQNLLLVEPIIAKYYGTGVCQSVEEPLDTVTTKERFLLVEPKISCDKHPEYDLHTRMLQPHELKLAHSFPKHFVFTGSKEAQTKQIGNSVPVKLAQAHVAMLLPRRSKTKIKPRSRK